MNSKPKKLLFFVAEDWYFVSHRLTLAEKAISAGFDVSIVCRESEHGDQIRAAGIKLIPLEMHRSTLNPFSNLILFWQIFRVLRSERPDVLHNVAQKPVVLGTLAARLAGVPRIVNALGGLGIVFSSDRLRNRLLRRVFALVYRMVLSARNVTLILQNRENLEWFIGVVGLNETNTTLIRGAGVDVGEFQSDHNAIARTIPVVTLVARLLRAKGIVEFIKAAHILNARGCEATFLLVGDSDKLNPEALSHEELHRLLRESKVQWLGRRSDIKQIWQDSDISVLPTYYPEGVPLSLLESAAMGKPIITTDVPGCNDLVIDGLNGFLVPPKDPLALADAIEKLVLNPELREQFGRASRERAVKEFSSERVIADTLALYEHSSHCA